MSSLAHGTVVAAGGSSGNFLVSPSVGLMIWTLLAFGISFYILKRLAFPRIADALDRRRRAIEESIESAERTRREADQLLEEYRGRLREAREQADEIVVRARRVAEVQVEDAKVEARELHEDLMASTRRDIDNETRRALDEIRREVANLTVAATEKLTRKSLDGDDHKRLIDEALREVDFSSIAPEDGDGRG
jgi:F-type H+-transporting ATPase subunit b